MEARAMGYRKNQIRPVVSAVLPVYNRGDLVKRSLQSVLCQSLDDLEVIVVDDGSTDDLATSLGAFDDRRLRVVSLPSNLGAAAARNAGVSEAHGQYIAFIDSDDWWLPQKVERQLEAMRGSGARWSCTASIVVNKYHPAGVIRSAKVTTVTSKRLASGCVWSPGSTLVAEKKLFDEVGLFDEQLVRLEDWDWLLRASKKASLMVLDEPLSCIDGCHGSASNYDSVKSSTRRMRQKHNKDMPFFSLRGLQFRAALERELAAAAYREGLYAIAVQHISRSLLHVPYLHWDTIRRLANAVSLDILRAIRVRRTGA